ncbi:hypothetical protein DMENIID0001_127160 [Sergentomyia squamirostris]
MSDVEHPPVSDDVDDLDDPAPREHSNRCGGFAFRIIFSAPGLVLLVAGYSVMGAFIFPLLEAPTAQSPVVASISKSREDCLRELWTITGNQTQLSAPENVTDRPPDSQSSAPRLNLARSPLGQKGRRYQPPTSTSTSGAFARLGPPVKPEQSGQRGHTTLVGTHPRGQPRITRVPPSPNRLRTTSSRGKHGRGRIRPVAPDLIKAATEQREGRLGKSEDLAGQVFKSPVKPPRTPERPKPNTATRGTRPPPDLLQLFGESPPRTPGRSENQTPSNTPPTPGRGLELLPTVRVVIDHKERRLTDEGNQSPLVRRRWRASRLSETSSEEEPVGRIAAKAAEEILLEEASPKLPPWPMAHGPMAKAAEILERALP